MRELENVIERLVVTVTGPMIELEHLSSEIRSHDAVLLRPKRERRRTVADDLYKRMIEQHESFWTAGTLFMDREITRANVREVVRRGLEEARGNYKIVARLFNMEARDYKRFLNSSASTTARFRSKNIGETGAEPPPAPGRYDASDL